MVGEHVDYLGSTNDVRPYLIEHNIFVLPLFLQRGRSQGHNGGNGYRHAGHYNGFCRL